MAIFSRSLEALDMLTHMLPKGYVLGKLHPHHAEMVASQWPRLHDWPNKIPYFRELINSYFCPAIYSVDNLDEPASYIVQFPCNQTFGYTNSKHKSQHLVTLPGILYYISLLAMAGYTVLEEEASDPRRVPFFIKIGAAQTDYNVKDLVLISKNSKL